MSIVTFPQPDTPPRGFALFRLGFRPFFFAAGLSGAVLMLLWTLFLGQGWWSIHYYPPTAWHGHEMLFGYSVAVVVGFLLTAVRNWTQIETVKNGWLAALAGLWLAGRIAPFLPLPPALIAAVDASFLPLAAAFIAWPIVKARQYNNLIFLPILSLMALANLLFHLCLLGHIDLTYAAAVDGMRWLLVVLLILMAGRVIPFFIERGHPDAQATKSYTWLEMALIPLTIASAISSYADVPASLIAALFLVTGAAHWLRLLGWYQSVIWKVPMLWILLLGYAWLAMGLTLMGFAQFSAISTSTAQHALMAGSLGCLTVGMMARVTRGHTGRSIDANRVTVLVFVALVFAALLRVFIPVQPLGWILSGTVWALALGIFTASHLVYWWNPRVDGRPG